MVRLYFLYGVVVLLIIPMVGCGWAPKKNCAPADTVKTYKDIPGVTAEEIAAIEALKAKKNKFSYGVLVSTEMFPLPDGTYAGFSVLFCDHLTELFGIPFVPEVHEWDDLIERLDTKTIDFTGDLTPTNERREKYVMTLPIAERPLRIFTLADSNKILTEADVEGLTIAFLEDTTLPEAIQKQYRIPFKIAEVTNYPEVVRKLQSGEIDGFIDEAVACPVFDEYSFIRSQIFFSTVHSPVSMTTANPEFAPIVSVLNKYISSDTGMDKLFEFYQAGDFEHAQHTLNKLLTDEEKAYIKDLKDRNATVRVSFDTGAYPSSFYNKDEKTFQGIALEVLEEISKLTDIKFEVIGGADLRKADMLKKLETGEISMIAQLLPTEQRNEFFFWSTVPYSRSYYAIMSKSDFPNVKSHQIARYPIGVVRLSAYEDVYNTLFPYDKNLKKYDTVDECLDALEQGEIDLLMASQHMLITQTRYREKPGFKINLRLAIPRDSYFGFNKNEKVLCSIISKAQQFVPTEAIDAYWTNRSFDFQKKQAEERMVTMGIFSAVVLFLLLISVGLLVKTYVLDKRLKVIASQDALTGIFNRRYFLELAAVQIQRAFRMKSQCFLVIYDLDLFKAVNDKYGHTAGDTVLKETTQRIKNAIRPYDLFGRYGGEEFVLLMSDVTEIDVVNAVERLRLMVCNSPVDFENIQIPISASFGITSIHASCDLSTAIRQADEALYLAKERGRNRIAMWKDAHLPFTGDISKYADTTEH